jgi:2'-hydroxyisoflavone reductase
VRLVEKGVGGVFNATGPERPWELHEVLWACHVVAGGTARLCPVSEEFLLKAGVIPYSELPLWIPDGPEHAGFNRINIKKALAAGLTFRPLKETVRDTLEWDASLPEEKRRQNSLAPEREAELLARWRETRAAG